MSSTFLDLRTISFTMMLVTMILSFILCFIWRRAEDSVNAEMSAENLRAAAAAARLEFISEDIKIAAIFGIGELTAEDTHIQSILRRADAALYQAKRTGRNRVISANSHNIDFSKPAA